MTETLAIYRVDAGQRPLAGVFEAAYQRVIADPTSQGGRVVLDFALSFLVGSMFDLSRIERLEDERDGELCAALFDYCVTVGLTEDERLAALDALVPYTDMLTAGNRH